jgi:hypothetical protein
MRHYPSPPVTPSIRPLWARGPVLWPGRRLPVWGRSRAVLLRRPALLWRPILLRWSASARRPGPNWPVVRLTRPYGLDCRPAVIRRSIVVRWPVVPRRTIPRTTNRMGESRPRSRSSRTIDRSGRTVVRWPIAPIPAKPRTVVIQHGSRAIIRARRTIAAIPTPPRTAVVVDPPASPIPSPSAPSPRLADQKRGDADGNAERDESRACPAGIHHRGIVLRQVHHLRIRRLNHIDGLAAGLLHLNLLLGTAAQCARGIGLRPQALDGRRHLALIGRDRRPNRGIVVDILSHHLYYLGKARQGDEGRIKTLLLGSRRELRHAEVLVLPQPVIEIQDLLRIGRRRRDLRQQSVGIQRHRRQQLIQLLWRGHWRSLRLQIGCEALKHQEEHQKKNSRLTWFAQHSPLRIQNRSSTILL